MPEKLTSWRQISDAERVFGQPIIALVSIRKTMGAIQCNGCPFAFTYKIIKSNVIYSEVSNKLISDLLKYFSPNPILRTQWLLRGQFLKRLHANAAKGSFFKVKCFQIREIFKRLVLFSTCFCILVPDIW